MTPGQVLDRELTRVLRAAGAMTRMVVKRRIVRSELAECAVALRDAAGRIEAIVR